MHSSNPRTALKIICLFWLSLLVGCSRYEAGQAAFNLGDYQTAYSRWERLAQFGNARAQNKLGYLYERGLGVSKNTETAFSWYQKSAEAGLSSAQNNVGLCHLHGIGTDPNPAEARRWFELAVAQGHVDAANNLGVMFNHGRGVPENNARAVELFEIAANQGVAVAKTTLRFFTEKVKVSPKIQGKRCSGSGRPHRASTRKE